MLVGALLALVPSLVLAQGLPSANQGYFGPTSGSPSAPTFRLISPLDIDAAFGSTRGSVLERGASGWQIITPGTSGFPWVSNGAGADPGYQALTAAGIASGAAASNIGTLGGDLSGTLPNATLAWISRVASKTETFNNSITWAGTDSTTMTFPSSNGTIAALNIAGQTLTGGAVVTAANLGTVSSGTLTINCGTVPLQFFTNNGAFTLAAPAADSSCMVLMTNGASAGAVSFSGFSEGSSTGDPLTTTNTQKFTFSIWRINGTAGYRAAAHQ